MHKFEDLLVWKKSMRLTKMVYELSKDIPSEEKYGLVSQCRRAAISIPSNIAEGAGRNSDKEFCHFLAIAQGSTYELLTQLILMKELNFTLKIDIYEETLALIKEIQNMNYKLQKSISLKYKENQN